MRSTRGTHLVPVLIGVLWLNPHAAGMESSEKVARLPIVDKAIAFHGGEAYERSRIALTVTSLSGSFQIDAGLGELFDYVVSGEVGRDTKVLRKVHYSNDEVHRWDDGKPVELDEKTAQQARDFVNARVFFPFLPYGLNGPNVFKEDLGLVDWDGQTLHKVKVTFRAGTSTDAEDAYMFWFEPDTGRMAALAYDFRVGDGGLRFRKVIGEQRVGGILFSDQENYAIDGQGYSVDQLTPAYVAEHMTVLSTVKLSDIRVSPEGA